MPRRHILTERQRSALLDLPTDELLLLRYYTLGDDDLAYIQERRRPENRLGFALQLCALRYPGRVLAPGEVIPHEVLSFAGLNLLTAIIIYWNTVHLGHAVAERRNEGLEVPPELLAHISPLGWAHILLTGEYLWPKEATA